MFALRTSRHRERLRFDERTVQKKRWFPDELYPFRRCRRCRSSASAKHIHKNNLGRKDQILDGFDRPLAEHQHRYPECNGAITMAPASGSSVKPLLARIKRASASVDHPELDHARASQAGCRPSPPWPKPNATAQSPIACIVHHIARCGGRSDLVDYDRMVRTDIEPPSPLSPAL